MFAGHIFRRSGFLLSVLLILMVVSQFHALAAAIKDYRPFAAELYTADKKLARVALRKFTRDKNNYYLAVDPDTLNTEIAPVGKYLILKKPFDEIRARNKSRAYFKAIMHAEKKSRPLQNAGITHIPGPDAVYLTADLCPSRLPLDRALFNGLISVFGKDRTPVPIGLCVTGRWIKKHPDDMQWLIELNRQKKISITWINHSYSHHYQKKLPFWKNFFLHERNSVESEILMAEKSLLEYEIVPSVFFRFPGLVSNQKVFSQVTMLGLIPVGSDAWLGKDQRPKSGSIILVHANGQEPAGIQRFFGLLQEKKKEIIAGRWVLADVREGIYKAMKIY